MEQYTIPCTEEQATKAFELGANIIKVEEDFNAVPTCYVDKSDDLYEIPTAEQMIGWLEEQGILIDVEMRTGIAYVYDRKNKVYVKTITIPTRKEATLAAIDAALDYLSKNK